MNTRSPIPVRPVPFERSRPPIIPLAVKCATAAVLTFAERGAFEDVVEREYPAQASQILQRAASTISSTSSITAFSQTAPSEYLGSLAPSSAGLTLLRAEGTFSLQINANAAINVATLEAAASGSGFVLEGAPIPVRAFSFAGTDLSLRKFCGISVFRREVLAYSRPSIEKVLLNAMNSSMFAAFDPLLLDANAETSTRPAGLRAGISALDASNATLAEEAIIADLQTVIGSVSAVANNGPIYLLAAPKQAVAMRLRQKTNSPYAVYSTAGLSDRTVMAIAANCLVSAIDSMPKFSASDSGTLHMDDSPSPISAPGSPNVVAAKTINLFQEDSFALRATFDVGYLLRSASGLAWITGTNW